MKKNLIFLILYFSSLNICNLRAQQGMNSFLKHKQDSLSFLIEQEKQPWRARTEVILTNVGVWAFNFFISQEDFAKITWSSVGGNFKHAFVWDNDKFSTNLFAHPYHGGLYFNAARCNGLSFWESVPYAFGGSLMWELFAERDPPSINDLIATTIGGIALGEMTNRLSLLVLDDSKVRGERVGREILSFIISPMRGLNRLITGEMWRYRSSYSTYHDYKRFPVQFSIGLGTRYLADKDHLFLGEHSPFLNLRLNYGRLFSAQNEPYDYFSFNGVFNLWGNQPVIGEINLLAKLWGIRIDTKSDAEILFGFYQHFNYFDAEPVIDGRDHIPYKISEAASFGPGLVYRIPLANQYAELEQRVMASVILLGGSSTDYYNFIDRNYNLGSGYGLKSLTKISLHKYGQINFKLQYYNLFTWKGYHDIDLSTVDPLYLNAQGDKGNVQLFIIQPETSIRLSSKLYLNAGLKYYIRQTSYDYHQDVKYTTFEANFGLHYVW